MLKFNFEPVDKKLVKQIVQTKLGVDSPSDALLDINIDEIEQAILNYCNIDVVPKQLMYTFANMVCDINTYDSQVVKDNTPATEETSGDIEIPASGINSVTDIPIIITKDKLKQNVINLLIFSRCHFLKITTEPKTVDKPATVEIKIGLKKDIKSPN